MFKRRSPCPSDVPFSRCGNRELTPRMIIAVVSSVAPLVLVLLCSLPNVIPSAPGSHTTSTWITSTMSSSRRNSSMRKLREGIELTVFTQEQTVSVSRLSSFKSTVVVPLETWNYGLVAFTVQVALIENVFAFSTKILDIKILDHMKMNTTFVDFSGLSAS